MPADKRTCWRIARVRDRLLQRLLSEGLNKKHDLPYFLYCRRTKQRPHALVRDRAMKVHKLVTDWHARENSGEKNPSDLNPKVLNRPYVDLMSPSDSQSSLK